MRRSEVRIHPSGTIQKASVVKLGYTRDLESRAAMHAGSMPVTGTKRNAHVAKLADAPDSNPGGKPYRFESCFGHQGIQTKKGCGMKHHRDLIRYMDHVFFQIKRITRERHHMTDATVQQISDDLDAVNANAVAYIAARDAIDADLNAQIAALLAKGNGAASAADLNALFAKAEADKAQLASPVAAPAVAVADPAAPAA
jgi:hypothetical protein